MGIDPVTTIVGLGVVAVGAYALFLDECEREEERRRRQEEEDRKWHREAREREKEARRREREMERDEQVRREEEREMEREDQARREEERERREWEIHRRQEKEEERIFRRNALSNSISDYNYGMENTSVYYSSQPYYYRFEREPFFSSYGRYSPEEHINCRCAFCNPEQARSRTKTFCDCPRCQSVNFNLFNKQKNSITVTFTPPQTTQDKNQNAKNQGYSQPSSNNSQGAKTSNSSGSASKRNTNSAPKASSSRSQQPQQNSNNNNNNNNSSNNNNNNNSSNNNNNYTVQDYGKINDFIKKLKAILDYCKASAELREKILSFFNKFEKHEENFLRLLEDYRIQNIAIEDILSIVIRLFQSDYFAKDVAYKNYIALMEIVAKYIKDELFSEMVEDSLRGNKKPFHIQRAECMKKVLQRNNILAEITDMFEKVRKEIVKDNTNQPLEPDFSGIFTKVYHYFKHKDVRGKEWTVTEYFDWVRMLLTLLKGLNPEYVELTNVNHIRREIVFEVYSTVFQGRFHIVVRAYGPRLHICTFFLKERYDKKAKDGDKYVDGKKKQ